LIREIIYKADRQTIEIEFQPGALIGLERLEAMVSGKV
jgi:hypothetical protein